MKIIFYIEVDINNCFSIFIGSTIPKYWEKSLVQISFLDLGFSIKRDLIRWRCRWRMLVTRLICRWPDIGVRFLTWFLPPMFQKVDRNNDSAQNSCIVRIIRVTDITVLLTVFSQHSELSPNDRFCSVRPVRTASPLNLTYMVWISCISLSLG